MRNNYRRRDRANLWWLLNSFFQSIDFTFHDLNSNLEHINFVCLLRSNCNLLCHEFKSCVICAECLGWRGNRTFLGLFFSPSGVQFVSEIFYRLAHRQHLVVQSRYCAINPLKFSTLIG